MTYKNHYLILGLNQLREFHKNPNNPTVGLAIGTGKNATSEERVQAFMAAQLEEQNEQRHRIPECQTTKKHHSRGEGWYHEVSLAGITIYERWMIATTTGKAQDIAHKFGITAQQVLAIKALKRFGHLTEPANFGCHSRNKRTRTKTPELKREIAMAEGSVREVAERYQVSSVTVRNYREQFGC